MDKNNLNIKKLIENSNEENSFISLDQARNLIEKNGNSISGINKFVKLKKGVVPMYAILTTVAAFAAAAVMTVNTFIDSPKEIITAQKQEIKQEQKAEVKEIIKETEEIPEQDIKIEIINDEESQQNDTIEKVIKIAKTIKVDIDTEILDIAAQDADKNSNSFRISLDDSPKKYDIDGSVILELSSTDFSKLGLENDPDKKYIGFWDEYRIYYGRPCLTKVYLDGGITSFTDPQLPASDTNVVALTPTLITDNKGNRRFVNISSGNGFVTRTIESNNNGVLSKSIETYPKNINEKREYENITEIQIKSNDEINKNLQNTIDSIMKLGAQGKLMIGKKIELKINPEAFDNYNGEYNLIDKAEQWDTIKSYDLDNDKSAMEFITKDGKKTIVKSEIQIESQDFDSLIKDIEVEIKNPEFSKSKKLKRLVNSLPSFDDINNSIEINKLIPIRVPVTKDFAFIFWYEPNEEFISRLPKNLQEKLAPELNALKKKEICNPAIIKEASVIAVWKTCAGAIENLQVNPNPTSGDINIKYNLQTDRYITISLNTIDGKKLYNLAENVCHQKGFYEEPYRLNDIPPGVYLISVKSDIGETAIHRIVVE